MQLDLNLKRGNFDIRSLHQSLGLINSVSQQEAYTRVARIPLVDIGTAEIKPLADQIARERGSVLDLYRMLLHSPPLAAGWLHFLTAIRHECELPGAIRELVIMRVAILNGASYEAEQHSSVALREGVTTTQLNELADWQQSAQFDSRERAALAYTDVMTRNIRVPASVFEQIRREFGVRTLVELTATIAAYNMVSRFLEALELHANQH